VARWEPGAGQRLQAAALALFQERGYHDVTVAEIAERAGLTRRTFFNHFADKREIFFAGAAVFRDAVVNYLAKVEQGVDPLDAAATALTNAGIDIGDYREYAAALRAIVDSSAEMRERELAKMADITDVLTKGLQARDLDRRSAWLVASCAVAAYQDAWQLWGENPTGDFAALMSQAITQLRTAVAVRPARAQRTLTR
jgi:AcrR family transcriptional regulator